MTTPPKPPTLSFRTRLTLLYASLTAVAGALLLGITVLLVGAVLPEEAGVPTRAPGGGSVPKPSGSVEVRAEVTGSIVRAGSLSLLAVVALAALLGWFMAGRALAPVRRITATARQVAQEDLNTRIALDGPADDIKELADTFDDMLARLERSFAAQSRFIANAAHELRTPLAAGRTAAEVAMSRPTASADLVDFGTTMLAHSLHQEQLLNGLLVLAQSAETVATRDRVDVAGVVTEVLHAAPYADDDTVAVSTETVPAVVAGDRVLLTQLARNVVDNAFRYNCAGGWVSVRTATSAGRHVLEVANSGVRIDPEQAGQLFEPFRRLHLDRVRRPRGHGLGLSVVRAIAEAHGGTAAARPRDEGGLVVEVTLPASSAEWSPRPAPSAAAVSPAR